MKRVIDILLSTLLLFLLFPLLFIVAILVSFKMGRPILFTQERLGLNEEVIKLYKFRSMTNDTDSDGNLLANHLRVTNFGSFIRRSSIDELPSLINVLKGDLSLVGPRPLLTKYKPFYKDEHRIRHTVRPGITGLAQVNGRNATVWQTRLDFDKNYVENQSLWLDFNILILTVYKVFKREGVEGDSDLSIIPLDKDKSYLENYND